MRIYSPNEAIARASQLLGFLAQHSHTIPIDRIAIAKINTTVATAQVWCEKTASIDTCKKVEELLGMLYSLVVDSLEAESKIEIQEANNYISYGGLSDEKDKLRLAALLNCFEIAGSTCYCAIHGHFPGA